MQCIPAIVHVKGNNWIIEGLAELDRRLLISHSSICALSHSIIPT